MKIIQLKGENVKRIKAISITPNDNVTVISGANGNGKTSVLDIIWLALKGSEAMRENPRVVRAGEESGNVELDLGEFVVKRVFSASGGSTLEVRTKDGAKFPSPQAMLDKLIGSISLDPLAFVNYDKNKQMNLLLEMTNLTDALSHKDKEMKDTYSERTFINRQMEKELAVLHEMELMDIPELPEGQTKIDTASLREKMKEAEAKAKESAERQKKIEIAEANLNTALSRVVEIRKQLESAESHVSYCEALVSSLKNDGFSPPEINTSEIIEQLNSADLVNSTLDIIERYERQRETVDTFRTKSNELTEKLEILRQEKQEAIESAKYPLEGLGFSDDGIVYNGIPFVQLSSAEKLKISIAMAINLQPKLKVIRITDGSLLDSKSMAIVEEMAQQNDMQVFIERVDESGKVGIVIEDGEVAKNNYETTQSKEPYKDAEPDRPSQQEERQPAQAQEKRQRGRPRKVVS